MSPIKCSTGIAVNTYLSIGELFDLVDELREVGANRDGRVTIEEQDGDNILGLKIEWDVES